MPSRIQEPNLARQLLMASSYVSCSVQKISKCTRQISFGWWGAVSVLCGKPGGVQLKYSKRAAETSPARRYLVVHHRSQPPSLLQEAKSLIWTLTGVVNPATITVGAVSAIDITTTTTTRQNPPSTYVAGSILCELTCFPPLGVYPPPCSAAMVN